MASDEHDQTETPRKSGSPKRSDEARTKRSGDGRRRPVAPVEEPIPLFGGRLLLAGIFLLAMVVIPLSALGDLLEKKDPTIPSTTWNVGGTATIAVTIITADYNLLTCASDKEVDGLHCAFKSEREPWPRTPDQPIDDNKASVIQPLPHLARQQAHPDRRALGRTERRHAPAPRTAARRSQGEARPLRR